MNIIFDESGLYEVIIDNLKYKFNIYKVSNNLFRMQYTVSKYDITRYYNSIIYSENDYMEYFSKHANNFIKWYLDEYRMQLKAS